MTKLAQDTFIPKTGGYLQGQKERETFDQHTILLSAVLPFVCSFASHGDNLGKIYSGGLMPFGGFYLKLSGHIVSSSVIFWCHCSPILCFPEEKSLFKFVDMQFEPSWSFLSSLCSFWAWQMNCVILYWPYLLWEHSPTSYRIAGCISAGTCTKDTFAYAYTKNS